MSYKTMDSRESNE